MAVLERDSEFKRRLALEASVGRDSAYVFEWEDACHFFLGPGLCSNRIPLTTNEPQETIFTNNE